MNTVRKQAEEQKDVKNIRQRPELAGKLLGPTSTTTAATEASEMKGPGSGLAAKRSEPRPHLFQLVRFARGLIGPDVVYLVAHSWQSVLALGLGTALVPRSYFFSLSHTNFETISKLWELVGSIPKRLRLDIDYLDVC
jgi:hypothetical protein